MLVPNKHSHPDHTVLAASTVLLKELRKRRLVSYDGLKIFLRKKNQSADYLFSPALSLLFLLGLVTYLPKADAFEYRGA
jgi:hypothetical protein